MLYLACAVLHDRATNLRREVLHLVEADSENEARELVSESLSDPKVSVAFVQVTPVIKKKPHKKVDLGKE